MGTIVLILFVFWLLGIVVIPSNFIHLLLGVILAIVVWNVTVGKRSWW